MMLRRFWLVAVLVWVPVPAAAESAPKAAPSADPLTLQQVLQSVQTHHPLLWAEVSAVAAARGQQLGSRGAFDPKLYAKASARPLGYYDYYYLDTAIEQLTPFWGARVYAGYRRHDERLPDYYGELETLSGGELRAGLKLPLWRDRATDAARTGRLTADAQARLAEGQLELTRLQLWGAAASAFFEWAAAQRALTVHEHLLELARARAGQVAQKVLSGALAEFESLDNQRSLLSREAALIKAQRKQQEAAIKLSLFFRDDRGMPRTLVSRAAVWPPEVNRPVALEKEDVVLEALDRHPALRGYRAKLQGARAELRLSETQVAPRLDLEAEASRDLGTGDMRMRTTLAPTAVKAGLTFELPLALRKARGKRATLRAKVRRLESQAQYARDKVRAAVRDAASALNTAVARLDRTRQTAQVAEKLAQGERSRFELGATSVIWVTIREKAAADAELDAIGARADAHTALARYQVALVREPWSAAALPLEADPRMEDSW